MRVKVEEGEVRLSFFKSTPLFSSKLESDKAPIIRVFRKEEVAFTFNEDYEEYFDGLSAQDAELIFEGTLDAYNDRKYTYVDRNVNVGSNYVYWVSSDRGDPAVGPAAVRVRDKRIWWPQDEIDRQIEQLARKYPQLVTLKSFGRTIRGRDIRGLLIGNQENCAAFVGLIHPGESGPELIIPAVERIMQNDSELLAHVGLAILPSVAIDQRQRLVHGHPGYLRTNFNGVDINRNFPGDWEIEYTYGLVTTDPDAITYRGAEPASEPETRSVVSFMEQTKPRCVFSFHCLASICGPTFIATKYGRDDHHFRERLLPYVSAYTRGFYGVDDKPLKVHYDCSAGSLPNWLYKEMGIPCFDLEWDGEQKSKISHTDNTTIELLEEYADRHYRAMSELLRTMRPRLEE